MKSANTMSNATPDDGGCSYDELAEASMEFSLDDKQSAEGDVRFRSKSSIEEIRRISRVSNYDLEEVINYWGDSDEKAVRKEELKQAVKEMYYKRRESDNDFTTLGLDDKAGIGRAVRKANKSFSMNAVLDEQELQIHEGVLDDQLLADVYSITSTAAKREGQIRAERLHKALKSEEDK